MQIENDILSVSALSALANPFAARVWNEQRIGLTREAIGRAIDKADFYPPEAPTGPRTWCQHIGRIGWFARYGWTDPIEVDIGVPGFPGHVPIWPITDGNHRFAAAIYRGDDTIEAEFSGSLDLAEQIGLIMPQSAGFGL